MLIRLFLASIAALLVFATAAVGAPSYKQLDRVTGTLIMPDGSLCSGTVFRKVILTSTHCVSGRPAEVRFRGQNMRVLAYLVGKQGENIMVKVDADLGRSARLGKRPKVGAVAWVMGNPMGLSQVFREARVSQRIEDKYLLDCWCWHGDSGFGVFDGQGNLVGIFYGAVQDGNLFGGVDFTYPYFYPLDFTKAQWAEAGR